MNVDPSSLIVTGGGRGIGAAIVRQAAASGYRVYFTYAGDRDSAEALVNELRGAGHQVQAAQADAADADTAADVFAQAEAAHGPVSALVNNAGITGRLGRFRDTTLDTMRRVVDVNLLGTLYFAQQAVRRWEDARIPGRMVNISSIAATLGAPGEYVHYAATKAGVEGFSIGLAREVASAGIRVNVVSPGTALTQIHAAAGEPGRPQRVAANIPMRRAGKPEEIAEAVMWLLSDASSYVTGSVMRVSGGL